MRRPLPKLVRCPNCHTELTPVLVAVLENDEMANCFDCDAELRRMDDGTIEIMND